MLYVASEDIPAGYLVIVTDPDSDRVSGLHPLSCSFIESAGGAIHVALGIARENLREGFRVAVRDGAVYEDDA